MKRRDVLRSLAGIATASGVASAQPRAPGALSVDAVEELMRAHGLEPLPGEATGARAMLLSVRIRSIPDPRIEPAIRLDPELD